MNNIKQCTALFTCMLMVFFLYSNAQAYHDKFDRLLKDHVKHVTKNNISYNGVNYDAWATDSRHEEVLKEIIATDPSTLLSINHKIAYWINAYNILTIDLITKKGERESIKNLGVFFKSPWKEFKWSLHGKEYSLDDIEHKIIRKLGEPRIHFAINCAAKSCPDLRIESYRADKIDSQLEEQANLTFSNESKGFMKRDGNAVKVTKVMDWFAEDFHGGNINKWLEAYFPNTVNDKTNIIFFKYDWSLNKQ